MFSGAGEKEDVFESVEAMPVFAGTSFIREGADNGSREGADNGSSGAKRAYVPVLASPSNPSQISGGAVSGASQIPWADAERYKLSDLDWGSNYDDGIDWAAIASDPLRQWS